MKEKVFIIGPGMEIGGVERSLLGLLDSIDYEKYEVDLFLLSHTGEFMSQINSNVNLLPEDNRFSLISWSITELIKAGHFYMAAIRLWSKLYGDLRAKITKTETLNITVCKKIISGKSKRINKRYDIALGFFGPHYFLEDKVDAKLKVGWVHTDYSNSNERTDVRYTLPMWEKLDYIACVSEQAKESFESVYPQLRDKTIVIENILSAKFVEEQSLRFDVSGEMPEGNYVKILSVGRFSKAKNFTIVPQVCRDLIKRGYRIKWYLIGYGPEEYNIIQKIQEYQVSDCLMILGKKDNPYPYINACDIYVQPSLYEGKAVTVREAQMLHKPVMITRFATSASQVTEGVDGYICEMSAQGITDGLVYLIDHPEVCSKLEEKTKELKYDNTKEINKIFNLYNLNSNN